MDTYLSTKFGVNSPDGFLGKRVLRTDGDGCPQPRPLGSSSADVVKHR